MNDNNHMRWWAPFQPGIPWRITPLLSIQAAHSCHHASLTSYNGLVSRTACQHNNVQLLPLYSNAVFTVRRGGKCKRIGDLLTWCVWCAAGRAQQTTATSADRR